VSTAPVTIDVRLDRDAMRLALERDARAGLLATPKALPSVWFYDDVGSELFDRITRLDEYYPTRAERALLVERANEIAVATKATTLVELGAGTCSKTPVLLDALVGTGTLRHYVAVDVAEATLVEATTSLAATYTDLDVTATVGDFLHLDGLFDREGPVLVAFLGGTIGNLEPFERHKFFAGLDGQLAHADSFLLGCDLVKDRARLVRAYDDGAGVTAAFNRNVLRVLNRELGADFDVEAFEHVALFDEERQWIEMRLRATTPQHVTLRALGIEISFDEGEEMRTEISAKFTPEGIAGELDRGGFVVDHEFGADPGEFLLTLSHPFC
jgi:L-histidine N-alpha-methyltransferase